MSKVWGMNHAQLLTLNTQAESANPARDRAHSLARGPCKLSGSPGSLKNRWLFELLRGAKGLSVAYIYPPFFDLVRRLVGGNLVVSWPDFKTFRVTRTKPTEPADAFANLFHPRLDSSR
jgi:hypothetical protein